MTLSTPLGTPSVTPTPRVPRRSRVLVALRVSALGVALLASVLAFAVFLYTSRGDVEGARRMAQVELRGVLDPRERLVHVTYVAQRNWWDFFRETHGVLAATDRRVLFLGVAPGELATPERGPQLYEEKSFPHDRPLRIRRGRVFLGTARGLVLYGEGGKETFAVGSDDRAEADSVVAVAHRAKLALRDAAERERRAQTLSAWIARRPVYHRVQRGDALISIATLYGTTPEMLQRWNALPRDVVKVGQRLIVKPGS